MFAVYTIYQDHEHLIPDAPELLEAFLAAVSYLSHPTARIAGIPHLLNKILTVDITYATG